MATCVRLLWLLYSIIILIQLGCTADLDLEHLSTTDLAVSSNIRAIVEIYDSINHLPPCEKIASASLVQSCSSFEDGHNPGSPHSTHDDLIGLKSLYAARLAVCEALNAGVPVPSSCTSFVPQAKSRRKTTVRSLLGLDQQTTTLYPDYDAATRKDLRQCTTALNLRPQSWTSYSNALQNAVHICKSMRSSIEKDQLLDLHAALNDILKNGSAAFLQDIDMLHKTRQSWTELLSSLTNMRSTTDKEQVEMERHAEQYHITVLARMQELAQIFKELGQDSQGATNSLALFQTQLDTAHKAGLERSNLVAAALDVLLAHISSSGEVTNQQIAHQHQLLISSHQAIDSIDARVMSLASNMSDLAMQIVEAHEAFTELSHSLKHLSAVLSTISSSWLGSALASLHRILSLGPLGMLYLAILAVIFWRRKLILVAVLSLFGALSLLRSLDLHAFAIEGRETLKHLASTIDVNFDYNPGLVLAASGCLCAALIIIVLVRQGIRQKRIQVYDLPHKC